MTQIPSSTPIPPQNGQPAASVPPAAPQVVIMPPPPRRVGLVVVTVLLVASVLLNFLMMFFVAAASLMNMSTAGTIGPHQLNEVVLTGGSVHDKVAVIRIEGIIVEENPGGLMGNRGTDFEFVKQQVDQVLADPAVKAVVVKVNSPGGGAAASDMMYHELKRLRDRGLPVIVHLGSVAASGGYYVAMAGDHLMAQRTCITGSIGVIGQLLTVRQLLEDHGVKVHTLTSGKMKGVGSPFSDLTDENKEYLMDTLIMSMYRQFVAVVQEGRPKIAKERLEQLADGRAYNADQALKEGLIDQIGFFDDAVALAAKRAGLAAPTVIQYERRTGLFDLLAAASQAQSQTIFHTTPDVLNAWTTPQVMLLWRGQ